MIEKMRGFLRSSRWSVAAFTCVVVGCGERPQTINLTLAHSAAPNSLIGRTADEYARRVNQRLAGSARVDVYPSSQLGSDEIVLQKLKLGTVDLAANSTVMSSVADELALFEMPYLVEDRDHMRRISDELFWPVISRRVEQVGYRIIGLWENGFRHVTNNIRPIQTPDDLRGLKLRTPTSPWRVRLFETFGARPSPLPYQDLFMALQTGLMDGQENPLSNIAGASLNEVQDYLTLTSHVYSPAYLVVSVARFAGLPQHVQRALDETARSMQEFAFVSGARTDSIILAGLEQAGMIVNRPDRGRFLAASGGVYADFGTRVPGGKELIDSALALAHVEN